MNQDNLSCVVHQQNTRTIVAITCFGIRPYNLQELFTTIVKIDRGKLLPTMANIWLMKRKVDELNVVEEVPYPTYPIEVEAPMDLP